MSESQVSNIQNHWLVSEPDPSVFSEGQEADSSEGGAMLGVLTKKRILCRYDGVFDYYSNGPINSKLPSVILLNAYGVNLEAWRHVVERLQESCNIFIWETRGLETVGLHGDKRDGDEVDGEEIIFGVEEQAVDILEVMEEESIRCAHIIAWCSGTKPAMVFQSQDPNRILSITCIAPNLTPFTYLNDGNEENWNSDWDTNVLAAANLLQDAPGAADFFIDAIRASIASRIAGDTQATEGRFGLLKMIGNENVHLVQKPFTKVESLINYFKMMKEYLCYDMTSVFENDRCPTQFIITPEDTISRADQAIKLSELFPGIEIDEVSGGTHFMMLTHGKLIADLAFSSILKNDKKRVPRQAILI